MEVLIQISHFIRKFIGPVIKAIPKANVQSRKVTKTPKRDAGFGVIETLVALTISLTVALGTASILVNMQHGQNNVKFRMDADSVNEEIRSLLSSIQACSNSFNGLVADVGSSYAITQLRDGPGAVRYQTDSIYGDQSLVLNSMSLSNYTPESATSAQMSLTSVFASAKASSGAQSVARTVNVRLNLNPATKEIISCITLAKMSDGIWQRTPGNMDNIMFVAAGTGGNVGIGTSTPRTSLEVAGAITPGNATIDAACTPEGAMAYDMSAHEPVFCSQAGIWALVNNGIGIKQRWVNMTGSRGIGVTYSNGTKRPMAVSISVRYSGANASLVIDGVTVAFTDDSNSFTTQQMIGIVPPGGNYTMLTTVGAPQILVWAELREVVVP